MASLIRRLVRPATPIVAAYLEACRARGLKPKTVTGYAELLDRLAQDLGRLPAKPGQLEAWLAGMELANESRRNGVDAVAVAEWVRAIKVLRVPYPQEIGR